MFFWSLILVVSLYMCVELVCDLVILELITLTTLVEIFWLPWKFCTLEVVCVSTPLAYHPTKGYPSITTNNGLK
jgi:hypothetical protein